MAKLSLLDRLIANAEGGISSLDPRVIDPHSQPGGAFAEELPAAPPPPPNPLGQNIPEQQQPFQAPMRLRGPTGTDVQAATTAEGPVSVADILKSGGAATPVEQDNPLQEVLENLGDMQIVVDPKTGAVNIVSSGQAAKLRAARKKSKKSDRFKFARLSLAIEANERARAKQAKKLKDDADELAGSGIYGF